MGHNLLEKNLAGYHVELQQPPIGECIHGLIGGRLQLAVAWIARSLEKSTLRFCWKPLSVASDFVDKHHHQPHQLIVNF